MKKINALLLLGCSLIILIILFSFGTLALGTDFATANQVKVNSPYSDNISEPGDENYYRFSLSTPGSFYLDFKHKNVYDDTELWNAILYNEKIEEIALYSFKGNEERTTTCVIGLDKGTYYLKIKGSNYIDLWENQQVINTSVYTLTLKFSKSNNYEKENNESFSTSTHIIPESIFYGSLNDVWDCDYYDFTIKETGNYHISFNHPCIYDNGNDEYFEVRLYNSTGKEIKYISSKGNTIKTDETIALGKGKYFLRIGGGYSYCGHLASQRYSNVTYNFGVVKTPSKVSNLKVDSSTSAISLSWSKVSGASGYQIYQYDSTKKKYVKIANVSSNLYKVSKLKSATTYKYAARAYKKVGSSYYYSSFVYITTATKPNAPTLTASAGTKKASLSWNKQSRVSGYIVYMATSKNGTFKKIAAVKGSTTSYTKTGLAKGKNYYFKVIAYKTVNDKNLYSAYSAVKGVKVK